MGCICSHNEDTDIFSQATMEYQNSLLAENLHINKRSEFLDLLHSNAFTSITKGEFDHLRTFVEKNRFVVEKSVDHIDEAQQKRLDRSSSCSHIKIDGYLVEEPDIDIMLETISMLIYIFVLRDSEKATPEQYYYFDETANTLKMKRSYDEDSQKSINYYSINSMTDVILFEDIHTMFKRVYTSIELGSEALISFIVYLDRVRKYHEFVLNLKTWRRTMIAIFTIISKITEDLAVWNQDISKYCSQQPVRDINKLEELTLKMMNYNLHIPNTIYKLYTFELKALSKKLNLSEDLLYILTDKMASKLGLLQRSDANLNKFQSKEEKIRSNTWIQKKESLQPYIIS